MYLGYIYAGFPLNRPGLAFLSRFCYNENSKSEKPFKMHIAQRGKPAEKASRCCLIKYKLKNMKRS